MWGSVSQTELFKTLERQNCRAAHARIIFGFPLDMPTVDVLATVEWNTLMHQYKFSIIKLFYQGFYSMFPHALAEQLITHSNRSVLRMNNGLIAPRFASQYGQNAIAYGGAVLWNAIGRSKCSIVDYTDMKSFLKNVVKCCAFNDFNFNVLAPQM